MIGLNDTGSIPTLGILILSYDRIVKMHFWGRPVLLFGGRNHPGHHTKPKRNVNLQHFPVCTDALTAACLGAPQAGDGPAQLLSKEEHRA